MAQHSAADESGVESNQIDACIAELRENFPSATVRRNESAVSEGIFFSLPSNTMTGMDKACRIAFIFGLRPYGITQQGSVRFEDRDYL